MITHQAQIKINLPVQLKELIESKATQFGLPVAAYIKHLILKEVEDMDYPVYEASDETIRAAKRALKHKDKAIVVKDVHAYFNNMK